MSQVMPAKVFDRGFYKRGIENPFNEVIRVNRVLSLLAGRC